MNTKIAIAYLQISFLSEIAEKPAYEGHGRHQIPSVLLRACPELAETVEFAEADESRHHWARVGAPGSWIEYAGAGECLLRDAPAECLRACSGPSPRYHDPVPEAARDAAERELLRRSWELALAGEKPEGDLRRALGCLGHAALSAVGSDVRRAVAARLGLPRSSTRIGSEALSRIAA